MKQNEINWKLILITCSIIVCVIMGVRNCFGLFLEPISLYNNSGANPWGGISADLERGIVYTVTGNPHSYFDGTLRPGDNTYASSVIALSIEQKKILWHFQETSHDIWNHDIPSPPILTKIKKDSKIIDVVVVPTKRANTLILDRVTGEPIYDFIKRK